MQKLRLIAAGGVLAALGVLGFVVPGPEAGAEADAPGIEASAPSAANGVSVTGVAEASAPGPEEGEAGAAPEEREPALETIRGSASYYADMFEGRTTASGVPFRQAELWAAHRTLPFGTRLRVTNLANGREVEVEVVDRGPYAHGRVLDLSKAAARRLDFIRAGHTRVRIEVLERP